METVQIGVRPAVFQKLQKLAVPLVDDTSSVIERLIEHWEKNPPSVTPSAVAKPAQKEQQFWTSSRGEALPVDGELRARYFGKTYSAKVTPNGIEYNGKTYNNPSAAAIAVKNTAGTKGDSAATNGWDFWEIYSPQTKQWRAISALRKVKKVDVQALLQELDRL
jgi:hypothetical protein